MPNRWLTKVLRRIKDFAGRRDVVFTLKALRELVELGLDVEDARDVLTGLSGPDCGGRRKSTKTGEWMYVFKSKLDEQVLYVKVVLRSSCVLISFHEDEDED